jgi:hypothetical protein
MTMPLLCKYVNRYVYGYESVPVADVPDVPVAPLIELEPPSTEFKLTFESHGTSWACALSLQMDGDTPVAFNFLHSRMFGGQHSAREGRVVKNGSDRYFKCEHDYYTIFTTLTGGEDPMLLECVYIPCTRVWVLPIGVRRGVGDIWEPRFYGCEVVQYESRLPRDPPSCVCDRYIKMPVWFQS